ncbi:type II secretion system protein GspN [Pelovirga terrestris]|uniref:Type II secretion system protein GspN n=1 Tax=Pelovirga terrestris TaxID=2771352 RepID=A0A8J6QN25_9BACT|nr:type II secretion system protein GspN [Pelovirga terrestris]MBD1400477.1 type II secretion system protein GspN [Pelovirga terrestris]
MKNNVVRILSGRVLGTNLKLFTLCLVLFCLSGFLSFWVFFPAEVLLQRLVQEVSRETGLRMRGEQATMLMPLGLKSDMTIYPNQPGLAPLLIDDLHVTPLWTSLLTLNQAIHLKGTVTQGDVSARIWRNGNVNVTLQNLELLGLQDPGLAYRLAGLVNLNFEGERLLEQGGQGAGRFKVDISDLLVLGLERIGLADDVSLGLLQMNGNFSESRVSVEQLVATGGVLELSGGGTLLVGATPEQTRLNLNVRVHPTRQTPDNIRDLLMLTGVRPGPDGSYTLQIGGTAARPVLR